MNDKRHFYNILRIAKNLYPEKTTLVESIKDKFDALFESITPRQKMALKAFPTQYVKRIHQDDGGWTSQLHIWAEEGVKDILNLDPHLLSYKNSNGETILMCYCIGATGTLTGFINHDAIEDMLYRDFSYDMEKQGPNGEAILEKKNVLDEEDFFGQTILDQLIDIAYATGDYSNDLPDDRLQNILEEFSGVTKEKQAAEAEEAAKATAPEQLELPEPEADLQKEVVDELPATSEKPEVEVKIEKPKTPPIAS